MFIVCSSLSKLSSPFAARLAGSEAALASRTLLSHVSSPVARPRPLSKLFSPVCPRRRDQVMRPGIMNPYGGEGPFVWEYVDVRQLYATCRRSRDEILESVPVTEAAIYWATHGTPESYEVGYGQQSTTAPPPYLVGSERSEAIAAATPQSLPPCWDFVVGKRRRQTRSCIGKNIGMQWA